MTRSSAHPLSPTLSVAFVTLLWLLVFVVRLAGPATLTDDDQERPAAYIADVLTNGNWIVQVDDSGDVTSKPPMYTWIAAVGASAWGRLDLFTLYLPCGLAVLGVAWMVLAVGWRRFSPLAGVIAATAFLVSLPSFLLVNLARTDPVFVFFVVASTLLLWRLWETGKGTLAFWLIVTLATMTKGPLGLVLALGGLLAIAWERWKPGEGPRPGGVLRQPLFHVVGVLLFVGLNVGWLWLAQTQLGDAVTDKLIGRELTGHSTGANEGVMPGRKFYQPPLWLVARFLPWSIASAIGVWMVFRKPAANASLRRFERFLAAYLLFGLFLFSMSPHQRHVHLMPLMFAMALFAGRVIDGWVSARNWRLNQWKFAFATLGLAIVVTGGYNVSRYITGEQTRQLLEMGRRSGETFGSSANVANFDSSYAFQFPGNTHVPRVNTWRANSLLSSDIPAFVAITHWERLKESLWEQTGPLYRFGITPDADFGTDALEIISNHPRLEVTPSLATYIGDIRVTMHGAVLVETGPPNHLRFHATQPEGRIQFVNDLDPTKTIHVTIVNADDTSTTVLELPRWQWRDVLFTAPADRVGVPRAEEPSWLRRASVLVVLAGLVLVGAMATRRALSADQGKDNHGVTEITETRK